MLAEPAEEGEGVDPCPVPALESDHERVLADQTHLVDLGLLERELIDGRETPGKSRLALALSAGAGPAQLLPAMAG